MNKPDNPRAVAGDNQAPDHARQVTEMMARDYAELARSVDTLLAEASDVPERFESDDQMGVAAKLIKRLRDTTARIEAFQKKEKEPFLRGGQAVDAFFFSLWEKCARRVRTAKPGAADILQGRVDEYQQRKLAEEQARRQREAEQREREAREAREREQKAAREAEEARLSAERARKPQHIEAKTEAADQREAEATAAKVDAMIARDAAETAQVATLAKSADLVRTRVDEGPMVTMAREAYAEVVDADALNRDKLWPFIGMAEKEKALRAWARTTGHKEQMAGAKIGFRDKTVVR